MPENPQPPRPPPAYADGAAACSPAALTLAWFFGARFLPERVASYPFWLAAALWNGPDGQGGISHLLG